MEEYVEGLRSLAVPLNIQGNKHQVVLFVVGIKAQIEVGDIEHFSIFLKKTAEKIEKVFNFDSESF